MTWVFAPILWSCSAIELLPPTLDRVEPSFAYNGEATAIAVYGDGLWPRVAVDAQTGDPEVDRAYAAWLVGPDGADSPLIGAAVLDAQTLAATVPAGLAPGLYDVVVEGPTGARATLADAFSVTSVLPDRLELTSLDVVTVAGETIEAEIFLLDRDGALVEVGFDVRVWATLGSPQATGAVALGPGTLAEAVASEGLLEGRLTRGQATIDVTSDLPGTVTLRVEAVDPDAEVAPDTLLATYLAGGSLVVELDLPEGVDPVFSAGDAVPMTARLVDATGNPLDLTPTVFLGTDCSGWFGVVTLNGPTPFDLIPEEASDAECPVDRVRAVYGATGESAPFQVVAGPVDHFNLTLGLADPDAPVVAGTVVDLTVSPVDVFGNAAPWLGEITLLDSVAGVQDASCGPSGPDIDCTATLVRAGTAVVLTARGSDGTIGVSTPFTVVADDVPASLTMSVANAAVAGEALPVLLQAFDTWNNPMSAAELGVDAFAISDALAESDCAFVGYAADGSVDFDCLLFTAGPTALAGAVTGANGTVLAPAVAIDVANGALAEVEIDGEGTKVAGAPFVLVLTGRDAWGNLYVDQTDPHVDLRDDSGTYSQTGADLGSAGTVSVSGSITRAGLTTVRVSQGGADFGASDGFLVLAGSPSALAIAPQTAWGWVDEPLPVQVEVVDAYGNRADGDLSATLSSAAGAPSVQVQVVNGVGEGSFLWPEVAQPDVLTASGNGWVGQTEITVSARCDVGGPVVDVAFGGYPEAVACLDDAGSALVSADLSGSVAGDAPLATYGIAEPGRSLALGAAPAADLVLSGAGAHDLWALVVDESGCGDEVQTAGWAGPDDGTPVGPVPLAVSDALLELNETVTLEVTGATDCARDPSASELFVRATGGALGSVVPTGEGLSLALDNAGHGTATLTNAGGVSSGVVEVHATVASGAAGGYLEVTIDGDELRPVVVSQSPIGPASGLYSSAELVFSEPLLLSSVTGSSFSVLGPTAVTVAGAQLLGAGDVVELSLASPVDATADVYTVVANTGVRDLAGNRLSGDWSGATAEYRGAFGNVGAPPAPVSCDTFTPAGLAFRPDGDDGEGEQSDTFSVDLSAPSAPAYWVVNVRSEEDQLVWQAHVVPVGAVDTVAWSGRGFDGLVAPAGSYALEVYGDDGLGTAGDGCEVIVSLLNADGRPAWARP